ncbi:MAG: nif-specific transcriptional activator NifA [gamma proteobacterium symbiont of Ctena orbiculata]|uniref:Nif-specific regulatory protein n=1 Tax=Candidatus Thiodiazotropha taylori TaxID=2792791 RepID=A0A944MFF7_9GAMM|nr:nif-specific transcriptional activator NifA [Candidatus Thiodiazotropha taylori]PUB82835.1 MAG: nif-specific transcriptional activator NifA [gamma proteobacterium symbiont of Ctena orbiculata]MBT2990417.1 nif-specific transcriptional activator NifA [Candidatus Thiodiazotropha taylori]MBT2998071.1 nif-specific transcriptional activator NifA [Candidatus Thiodiazotropha taylori]MBT3002282.1 nif-specific transcriptional activator NifA [Candidatus Thiodiazotropha taylori]
MVSPDINPDAATGGRASSAMESELESLYQVSQVLSRSLDFRETLSELLRTLNDSGNMRHGMICLLDEQSGDLLVTALHENPVPFNSIRYKPGEGVVGAILENGEPLVVQRISDEDRFLDRLELYDPRLPFIGVPIPIGDKTAGVLAAQPSGGPAPLEHQSRFLQMVGNLVGQSVRLAKKVEDEQLALKSERDSLRRKVRGEHGFSSMVGHTRSMRLVFEQVRQVAKWNTTVLVRGESGTGKELIANAIHYNSPRSNGPFIKLNCAALPDTLLESELFGHEKGAFTGAVSQRKGRFEQADGGTIFLDEIGEISPAFQAKLLRVLQEGEFERVGGIKTQMVDVRVVAATNKDLETEVQEGNFREDLYYRLNVMPISMPPLRDRREDIPDLARFLVTKIGKSQGRELEIDDSAVGMLMRYDWPGNVRELENCLERAAVMSEAGLIDRKALNLTGLEGNLQPGLSSVSGVGKVDIDDPNLDERERVIAALEQAGWVQAKAARLLGMTPRQIGYRIQTLNIKVRQI